MDVDSSSKFIGSLTKFLQSLCNGYVEFQRGVELVGHIYLNIDTGEKVDYVLHEKVNKSDENSVTFVSNSYHAQPVNKDTDKKAAHKDAAPTPSAKGSSSKSDDDDDDIVIVDHTKGMLPGSTNSGTIPSRGQKRVLSPSSDARQAQRTRMGAPNTARSQGSPAVKSPPRGIGVRPGGGGPTATVTSQEAGQQDNLNISDLKLEQITRDELLSLASQVEPGPSLPPGPVSSAGRLPSQRQGSAGSGEGMSWIKQEAADGNAGNSDTGWPHGRDDSNSNSGSNLYPVMLHPNPAAFSSGPVFPGFSGPNTSGTSSSTNPYANPVPMGSQDMSGLDPSVCVPSRLQAWWAGGSVSDKSKSTERVRRHRARLRENPVLYRQSLMRQMEYNRRHMAKLKQQRSQREGRTATGSQQTQQDEPVPPFS